MVLNSHYANFLFQGRGILNFMWTGVYLFFVITGFLFARYILYKDFEFLPYAIRRFFRIYPLYIFSLFIYYFITQNGPHKIYYFIKHIFFLNTITCSKNEVFFFNPAYWSLPVEIEFYLVVPILAFIRKRFTVKLLLYLFPIFFLAKFLLALNASQNPLNIPAVIGIHIPGMMPEFSVGILLYVVYENFLKGKTIRFAYQLLIFLSGIGILSLLCTFFVLYGDEGINQNLIMRAFFSTFCAFGYALIILSCLLFFRDKQLKASNIFLFIGSISYGMYLFHNIFPRFTDRLGLHIHKGFAYFIYSVTVFLIALLCNRFIENPLRNFGRKIALKFSK